MNKEGKYHDLSREVKMSCNVIVGAISVKKWGGTFGTHTIFDNDVRTVESPELTRGREYGLGSRLHKAFSEKKLLQWYFHLTN